MPGPVHYHSGAFPPSNLRWEVLIPHLGPAAAAVARYDGMLGATPNADVLLSPLSTQEAVLSSRVEGTRATMGDVLGFEADASLPAKGSPQLHEDIREVLNYRTAMSMAEKRLEELPLSLRVIREIHAVLLDGVRGQGKAPGEFRRRANSIGSAGATIDEARFVPIAVPDLLEGMSRWERYFHEEGTDRIVQVAVLHAEFESIHPFLDGNGRLGRILIPILLWQYGLIRRPMFYLSEYLEENREEYYDQLLGVSRSRDWTDWCRFFLVAVRTQADRNIEKAQAILSLYDELKVAVVGWTRSQFAVLALDWLFRRPIFKSTDFIAASQVPAPSARRLLAEFRERGLIREFVQGRGRRAAILGFPRLLNIAEGREVF